MRYFFESKVEKKDVGYTIQIPFNVWEVCHQREGIKGDIVLDNNIIQCELHPKTGMLFVYGELFMTIENLTADFLWY